MKKYLLTFIFIVFISSLDAQLVPNHIFDDNMVLQREKPVRIWGTAEPGKEITITFLDQEKSAKTDADGKWEIFLDPMSANDRPADMTITGDGTVLYSNVLVGDVWILGGQSNMEFDLARIYHGDAEVISANYPQIRLMTIPRAESVKPEEDFIRLNEWDGWYGRFDQKGFWFVCSPGTVKTFSGLGYIFGKRVHMASGIPIGLIDVSRGGTTVETWISPEALENSSHNTELLKYWKNKIENYDPEENLKTSIRNWEKRSERRKKQGLEVGPKPTEPAPSPAYDHNRPGACYNGMLSVFKGLTVKGVIFHHGYNNALSDARPKLYAENFKLLIRDWRNAFNDPDLPFGIIELSAGGLPQTLDNFEVSMVDAAPFIREGQFQAFTGNENTGYICSYDQQVNWYHPQRKVLVGERTARWALNTQYGFELGWEPALVSNIEKIDGKIVISFTKEIKAFDDRPLTGFAVAGEDRHFYPAEADYVIKGKNERGRTEYDRSTIEVSSEHVSTPVAVRYAWARNPLGNAVNAGINERIIPVPPFRTDKWDYPEAPYDNNELIEHRNELKSLRSRAEKLAGERR